MRLLRSLHMYDTEGDQAEGIRKPWMSFNLNKWKKSRKPCDGGIFCIMTTNCIHRYLIIKGVHLSHWCVP